MPEIWKDIKGYEGLYKISNTGKVFSCRLNKEMAINKQYYLSINLSKNGKQKHFYIHRLVAETFIPNPENKTDVNHIDHNPHNARADNLEWTTHSENISKYLETDKFRKLLKREYTINYYKNKGENKK